MRSKETVLVTAAAGGTGQFAVQLAKLAGNQVVATCGSDDKARLLTGLGADRVINYNKEQTKVCKHNAASDSQPQSCGSDHTVEQFLACIANIALLLVTRGACE